MSKEVEISYEPIGPEPILTQIADELRRITVKLEPGITRVKIISQLQFPMPFATIIHPDLNVTISVVDVRGSTIMLAIRAPQAVNTAIPATVGLRIVDFSRAQRFPQ